MNKTEPTTHMMKHKYLALAALVATAFAMSGCKSTAKKTNIVRTEVIYRAASPQSVAGKRIFFDYSSALTSEGNSTTDSNGNIISITWGPWIAASRNNETSLKFNKNNEAKNGKDMFSEDYKEWTYKKSGEHTATVTYTQFEYSESFNLTFETPTSGTITGGPDDELSGYVKYQNVRFIIK